MDYQKRYEDLLSELEVSSTNKKLFLDLKKEVESLRAQNQLQVVFDSSPAVLLLLNKETEIIKINKAGIEFFGEGPDVILNRQPGDALRCIRAVKSGKGCGKSDNCVQCVMRNTVADTIVNNVVHNKVETEIEVFKNGKIEKFDILISSSPAGIKKDNIYLVTIDDITRRKKNEQLLKENSERLELSIKGAGLGLWDWNIQTGNTIFNERWAEIIGFTLDELQPVNINTWNKYCHPDDLVISGQKLEEHFQGRTDYYECEVRMRHKKGYWVWVLDRGKVFEWTNDDKPLRMSGTHQEITQRKLTEDKLKQSESRFKQLANIAFEGIVLHKKGVAYDVNPSFCEMTGYMKDELLGEDLVRKIFPERYRQMIYEHISKDYDGSFEVEVKRKNGSWFTSEISTKILPGEGFRMLSVRDVTEQKDMQNRILNAIIQTEEQERKRVAQELHDGLGPVLSMVKLYAETYFNSKNEPLKQKIKDQLLAGINDALRQVSTISNNLSPHILDDFGLKVAIEKLISKIEKVTSIQFSFDFNIDKKMPKETEITLYRVISELINNTNKHAGASEVSIVLQLKNKYILFTYEDNGKGFDFNKSKKIKKGMGLFNIVNRIKSLNGNVTFENIDTGGVKYKIEIPF